MGACFCTGACRETGVCPNAWEWIERGEVKSPPLNIIRDKLFSDAPPSYRIDQLRRKLAEAEEAVEHLKERVAKAEGERNVLAGHLQDIYAHPAATPPILAIASGALEAFNFAKPSRWALDH